jgi:serine/threonine-protein kinase HipA
MMADSMFVWVWLPESKTPTRAGQIHEQGGETSFSYDAAYLDARGSISLYSELPLVRGRQRPRTGLTVAGVINDSWPDGWAKVVIERRRLDGGRTKDGLHPFMYLRESGSDRIGALDYTDTPEWTQRGATGATLDQLQTAAELIETGAPLDPELTAALTQATASGGMRPKALIDGGGKFYVAKLSSRSDERPVTNLEAVAMDLAHRVGLNVAHSELIQAAGRDILLVERFDRTADGCRRIIVSAATILGLDPYLGARYASYHEVADHLRGTSTHPDDARELFARITFNVIVGNTDDHARNHAAIWDGRQLTLAPAFDVCPQQRKGGETQQVMEIGRDGYKDANLAGCVKRAPDYGLDSREAFALVERQIEVVHNEWADAADRARLNDADRRAAWGGPILNESILYSWDDARPRARRRNIPTDPNSAQSQPGASSHDGEFDQHAASPNTNGR